MLYADTRLKTGKEGQLLILHNEIFPIRKPNFYQGALEWAATLAKDYLGDSCEEQAFDSMEGDLLMVEALYFLALKVRKH